MFGIAVSAQAVDPLLTPRLQDLHYGLRRVPVSPNEPDLAANRQVGDAKAREMARSNRLVPNDGPEIDLAHGPRPTVRTKDPNYEGVLLANAQQKFPENNRQKTIAGKQRSRQASEKSSM